MNTAARVAGVPALNLAGVGHPFTRSPASCSGRTSCTDGTGHYTDGTRCSGIIRQDVPRTVPRGRRRLTPDDSDREQRVGLAAPALRHEDDMYRQDSRTAYSLTRIEPFLGQGGATRVGSGLGRHADARAPPGARCHAGRLSPDALRPGSGFLLPVALCPTRN